MEYTDCSPCTALQESGRVVRAASSKAIHAWVNASMQCCKNRLSEEEEKWTSKEWYMLHFIYSPIAPRRTKYRVIAADQDKEDFPFVVASCGG